MLLLLLLLVLMMMIMARERDANFFKIHGGCEFVLNLFYLKYDVCQYYGTAMPLFAHDYLHFSLLSQSYLIY